jgi:hypothetical protein
MPACPASFLINDSRQAGMTDYEVQLVIALHTILKYKEYFLLIFCFLFIPHPSSF